jgi:hypothetical protein
MVSRLPFSQKSAETTRDPAVAEEILSVLHPHDIHCVVKRRVEPTICNFSEDGTAYPSRTAWPWPDHGQPDGSRLARTQPLETHHGTRAALHCTVCKGQAAMADQSPAPGTSVGNSAEQGAGTPPTHRTDVLARSTPENFHGVQFTSPLIAPARDEIFGESCGNSKRL